MNEPYKLQVFLCHASQDKPFVRDLYKRLRAESWIDPWLDEEKLLPGQDWDMEIEKAVESADAVIVCLSNNSVSKEGYIQRELKFALDIALEKPEGTIFIVPLRLDDCDLPRRLRPWQYVDYFPADRRKWAYQRLLQSLKIRYDEAKSIRSIPEGSVSTPFEPVPGDEAAVLPVKEPNRPNIAMVPKKGAVLDVGWTIALVAYFLLTILRLFWSSSVEVVVLLAISAILMSAILLYRRQLPTLPIFKISIILYLLLYSLSEYFFYNDNSIILGVLGFSALVAIVVSIVTFRTPKKPAVYASISLAGFFLLTAAIIILNQYEIYPDSSLELILSLIASILIWLGL